MVDKKTKKKNLYTALFLASLMVIFFLYTIYKISNMAYPS